MGWLSGSEQRACHRKAGPYWKGDGPVLPFPPVSTGAARIASQGAGPAGTWLCESKGKQVPIVFSKERDS